MTFLDLIKPYRWIVVLTVLWIFLANLLMLAFPWGIKLIVDEVLTKQNSQLLGLIIISLIAVACLRAIFNYLHKMTSQRIGEQIVCDLRERVYDHTQILSLGAIKDIMPSQILTRMTADVESVRRFIIRDVIDSIYSLLSALFIFIVIINLNWRLTLSALLPFPLFILFYMKSLPYLKEGHQLLRDHYGRLVTRIQEALNAMMLVRMVKAENHEKKIFETQQQNILTTAQRNNRLNVLLWLSVDLLTMLGLIVVLGVGTSDVLSNKMSMGELMAFYSYLAMLFSPVIRLVNINGSYQEASAALNRIKDILSINDSLTVKGQPKVLAHMSGSVVFRNVSFAYPSAMEEKIISDVSFEVNPAEVVAIVGASGVGKTTLIHLLLRFFDPQTGSIIIDGIDLKHMDLASYYRHVAVVQQDDYLFSGSVMDNIRYGGFEASVKEVERAAHLAHIHQDILRLKGGYQAQVGERGMLLSCGQRQRITIARALLRKPSLLILDEATSAVDALTENAIQSSIRECMVGKSVVMIAHRFSSIMQVDKIIVMEKGKIVETGDHNYLLNKQGFYSKLYLEQFKNNSILMK